MSPINTRGSPAPDKSKDAKKKHPIGTPAFPTAANIATQSQKIYPPIETEPPQYTVLKSTESRINCAQPFMLIVEHKGREKLEILGATPDFFVIKSKEKGSAALDDFVKNATETAFPISLKRPLGEIRFFHKRSGRAIRP